MFLLFYIVFSPNDKIEDALFRSISDSFCLSILLNSFPLSKKSSPVKGHKRFD